MKEQQQENTDERLRDASGATGSQMMSGELTGGQQVQMHILEQLRRVTEILDSIEDRMLVSIQHSTPSAELSTDSFLESIKSSKNVQ